MVEGTIQPTSSAGDMSLVETLIGSDCFGNKLLLNMERVTYMDSSGISWLLSLHKRCSKAGGKLVLHSVPKTIMSMLKLLQIDRHLTIVSDEQTAIALAL